MQISKIIFWPLNNHNEIRIIKFELGKVNYIIGEPNTGKSSIWPIIDYCLCSSELRIPLGDARDFVSWYAVVFYSNMKEIMIARRNNTLIKEASGETIDSEYMVFEGSNIEVPLNPRRNTSEKVVKRMLSEKFTHFIQEISKELVEQLVSELQEKKIGDFSFRDLLTLNHQMQYALVNPSSFIADSGYISILKLKKLLPLLLYTEQTAYYKIKKGIQYKVEKERQHLEKQLEYTHERMRILYDEAHRQGLVLNYIDPRKVKPFDEFYRNELKNIIVYNAKLLDEGIERKSEKRKILTLGKITECLEFAKVLDHAKAFDRELQVVRSNVNNIEYSQRQNTEVDEVSSLTKLIKAYAKKLKLEHLEFLPVFDDKDAMLKFTILNQYIYLYQIGNSQNYVGYNIATFLSLHEFFLQKKQNPVFSFLLMDHPFQAFSSGEMKDDQDKFTVLNESLDLAASRLNNNFQVIVLERIAPAKNLSNSVIIENWSSGSNDSLVPKSWKINS